MATKTISTTFLFRRGDNATFTSKNVVLKKGEPAYETDTGRMKIGDGVTTWSQLPYIDQNAVLSAETTAGFPTVGNSNAIYKCTSNAKLYQWNSTTASYELLTKDTEYDIINGGNAE